MTAVYSDAARGASLSRKLDACQAVVDAINARHRTDPRSGRAIAVEANISAKEALTQLADRARDEFGKIDILVCNAATNVHFGPLATIKDEQFRKILDNNILSNHWLIQMVAPEMIARREGAIVIVLHHQNRFCQGAVGQSQDRQRRGGQHAAAPAR